MLLLLRQTCVEHHRSAAAVRERRSQSPRASVKAARAETAHSRSAINQLTFTPRMDRGIPRPQQPPSREYDPKDLRARRPPPPDPARRSAHPNQPELGPRRVSLSQSSNRPKQQLQPPPPPTPGPVPEQVQQDWKADEEASQSGSALGRVGYGLAREADFELICAVNALYGTVSAVSPPSSE